MTSRRTCRQRTTAQVLQQVAQGWAPDLQQILQGWQQPPFHSKHPASPALLALLAGCEALLSQGARRSWRNSRGGVAPAKPLAAASTPSPKLCR